jgi:HSP20 family protein
MRSEFDALFNRFFAPWPSPFEGGWAPFADFGLEMDDEEKELVVRVDAPGFEAEDFNVQVSGQWFVIEAERKQEGNGKNGFRNERRFQRSVTLPAGVDADKVETRYRNGVLELHLPKTEEAQRRRIQVKTA